jgi:zinc D-Ala-D-Ala dipeptidase
LASPVPTIPIEAIHNATDFRALDSIAGIVVDLRYATTDNFVRRNVYAGYDCAWLHVEAAEKLEHAVALLRTEAPDMTLVVLDALRPHRIQVALWDALAGTGLQMYLAPPEIGSLHSYGMALDVTLRNVDGRELDMGTGFDAMVSASHPEYEARSVTEGTLTPQHVANRLLLRNTMTAAGFYPISTEWWHFDATADKAHVRARYTRVG